MNSEKSNRVFLCISFIFVLALVPVMQALPLNLQLLPEASAQSGIGPIVINSVKNNSATVTASPFSATLANFNAGTGANRLLVVGVAADTQSVSGITFGGTTLTKSVSSFLNNDAELWYL